MNPQRAASVLGLPPRLPGPATVLVATPAGARDACAAIASHFRGQPWPSRLLAALVATACLGWVTTSGFADLVAADQADNDPYPASHFQLGDNGGYGFLPWVKLESGGVGSRFLAPAIVPSHSHAWSLSGAYALGRGLTNAMPAGTWHLVAVHDPDNSGFSGFNLKTSTQAGFGADELLRFGFNGSGGTGIYVSTDGGANYTFLDCGWVNGSGDTLEYTVGWDGSGNYTLAVNNLTEGKPASFTGTMATGAVAMLGTAVFGASLNESLTFDTFEVTPTNAETWYGGGMYEVLLNDATGTAGASPGWNLHQLTGSLIIKATPSSKFTIKLTTFTGTLPGPADHFTNTCHYGWRIVTATAGITGFNAGAFTVDTTGVGNLFTGSFSVATYGNSIYLYYQPTCQPTTLGHQVVAGQMHMYFTNLSGLKNVQGVVTTNCTIAGTAFDITDQVLATGLTVVTNSRTDLPPGTTRLDLAATKDASGDAWVNAAVKDYCDIAKQFDPVITRLEVVTGNWVQKRFTGLLAAEHYLQVINGVPGLKSLEINLNGHVFRLDPLADGRSVAADLAAAMNEGDANVVVLTGTGAVGSSAMVLITDASSGNLVELTEILKLTLRHTASGLLLSWPATRTGWQLQQNASLATTNWTDVAQAPESVVEGWRVVLPGSPPPAMFYRLRQ